MQLQANCLAIWGGAVRCGSLGEVVSGSIVGGGIVSGSIVVRVVMVIAFLYYCGGLVTRTPLAIDWRKHGRALVTVHGGLWWVSAVGMHPGCHVPEGEVSCTLLWYVCDFVRTLWLSMPCCFSSMRSTFQ
jgi:hypothetical protein